MFSLYDLASRRRGFPCHCNCKKLRSYLEYGIDERLWSLARVQPEQVALLVDHGKHITPIKVMPMKNPVKVGILVSVACKLDG